MLLDYIVLNHVCDSATGECFLMLVYLFSSNWSLAMSHIKYWFERKLNKKDLLMFIVALLFRSISWGEEEERPKEGGTISCILSGW